MRKVIGFFWHVKFDLPVKDLCWDDDDDDDDGSYYLLGMCCMPGILWGALYRSHVISPQASKLALPFVTYEETEAQVG